MVSEKTEWWTWKKVMLSCKQQFQVLAATELPRWDWAWQGIFLDRWQCFVGFGTNGRSGQRWGKQMVAIYQDCLEISRTHYTDSSCWDILKISKGHWKQDVLICKYRYSQYIHLIFCAEQTLVSPYHCWEILFGSADLCSTGCCRQQKTFTSLCFGQKTSEGDTDPVLSLAPIWSW